MLHLLSQQTHDEHLHHKQMLDVLPGHIHMLKCNPAMCWQITSSHLHLLALPYPNLGH
jgi:hypothetical protein